MFVSRVPLSCYNLQHLSISLTQAGRLSSAQPTAGSPCVLLGCGISVWKGIASVSRTSGSAHWIAQWGLCDLCPCGLAKWPYSLGAGKVCHLPCVIINVSSHTLTLHRLLHWQQHNLKLLILWQREVQHLVQTSVTEFHFSYILFCLFCIIISSHTQQEVFAACAEKG